MAVIFKIVGLLLACTAICAEYNSLNSVVLTNVGEFENITDLTCEVHRSEKNTTLSLEINPFVTYNSSSSYPYQTTVTRNNFTFSIYKTNNAFVDRPAIFSLYEKESQTNLTFKIYSTYVILHEFVKTELVGVLGTKQLYKLFPLNVEVNFHILNSGNTISLGHSVYGTILTFEIENLPATIPMTVHNRQVTYAEWHIYESGPKIERINVDKYDTYCYNSSTTNEDKNNYDFLTMVTSQYKSDRNMLSDLEKLNSISNDEVTKEFLDEFYSDVKDTYAFSKYIHKKIISSNNLSDAEETLRRKYFRENVFEHLRDLFFEISKLIQLKLSELK